MATFDEIRRKIDDMAANVRRHAPGIVAETATEHFKERFRKKDWEGVPWQPTKTPNSRGSLMVRSGALLSTVRPTLVADNEVRIGAGNAKVPYAKIHNEGVVIEQVPTAKQKRFFWAMEHGTSKDTEVGAWGRMAMSKKLVINIPARRFMGQSHMLNDKITARLEALATQNFKK